MNPEQINLHIYPSTFTHESRILRITKTLVGAGVFAKVLVFARWAEGLAEQEAIDDHREVWRIRRRLTESHSGAVWKGLGTLEWSLRLIARTRGLTIKCINCHSLPVLPVCALLKLLKHSKLIYDTHELETETPHMRGLRRRLAKVVEWFFIKFVDEIVVVNGSIAAWYKEAYHLENVWVVRNIPDRRTPPAGANLLREKFGLPDDSLVFLHHGILGPARGIELLLDIFSRAQPQHHLVMMGFGPLEELSRDYAGRYPNIHFHDAVRPEALPELIASADIGIFLVPNICLSYYLALSNKFFEYLNGGLPVLISDFPEFHKIIEAYDCGWLLPQNAEEIAAMISGISASEIAQKKANAIQARQHFGWEFEEPTLLHVYEKQGFRQPGTLAFSAL